MAVVISVSDGTMISGKTPGFLDELVYYRDIIGDIITTKDPNSIMTVVADSHLWYAGPAIGVTDKFYALAQMMNIEKGNALKFGTSGNDILFSDSNESVTLVAGDGDDVLYFNDGIASAYRGGDGDDVLVVNLQTVLSIKELYSVTPGELHAYIVEDNKPPKFITIYDVEKVQIGQMTLDLDPFVIPVTDEYLNEGIVTADPIITIGDLDMFAPEPEDQIMIVGNTIDDTVLF